MGAPSRQARRVRRREDFDLSYLVNARLSPRQTAGAFSWTLEQIRAARDAQMRGTYFRQPARLAESMRTDDALFVARMNRLAPQRSIEIAIEPAKGARGAPIAREADALYGAKGIGIAPETVVDIHGCLVDHGVAFAVNVPTVRVDGSRIDLFVKAWPIEWVRWDPVARVFRTQTDAGGEEIINHGDGRWIVFAAHELEPFKNATLLPAALVWARHACAVRDWAKGSVAHGNAKVLGEMPPGVTLQKDGSLTPEAAAFLDLLKAIADSDSPVGIRPAGAKTDFLVNNSTAWQVFDKLVENAERAAARIYLGTDGTLGATGGAPGVDIKSLFGVATTIVEADLEVLERGFKSGTIDPWCALNFGDSLLAPTRKYQLPDEDSDARRGSLATRMSAFFAAVKAARDAGLPTPAALLTSIATDLGVATVLGPLLAAAAAAAVPAPSAAAAASPTAG